MKHFLFIAAFASLAACGADGEPEPPSMNSVVSVGPGPKGTKARVGTGVIGGSISMHVGTSI